MSTTVTAATSSDAAAAAEAQRRAAEAAARRAEAARAAAAQKAEAARAQAEKAEKAQAEAVNRRSDLQATKTQLDQPEVKPELRQTLRDRLGEQEKAYSDARRTAVEETNKARQMLKSAGEADVEATGLSSKATGAAEKAGMPAPFQACDKFTGVESQNRQTFDKLFGPGAGNRAAERAVGGLAAVNQKAEKAQADVTSKKAVALYNAELKASGKYSKEWSYQDAADFNEQLATLAEQHADDPDLVKSMMTMAGAQLTRSAELLGQASYEDVTDESVEALTASLSRLGNAVDEDAAAQLAYGIASGMPNKEGLGQVDDGFGHYADSSGDSRFRELFVGALHSQDKGDAAEEMVEGDPGFFGSIKERGEDVGEEVGEAASDVFNGIKDGVSDAFNFIGDKLNDLGDAIRHEAADLIDVDGRIAGLKKPGDTFTAHVDVEGNVLGAEATAGVEMKVTRTEGGGYAMDLTGRGSLGVAEKLSIPGLEAGVSAAATGEAAVHFEFDEASQVTEGAETVAGIAIGSAVGGPLGTAITGGSAIEEIGNLTDHFESAKVMVGVEGTASASLGEQLGLPSASAGATASAQVGVEIDKSGDVNMLLDQAISLEGSLTAGGVPLPGGGQLAAGAQGSGTVSLSTRIPVDLDFGELTQDPLGTIEDTVKNGYENATSTLSGNLTFAADDGVGDGAGVAVDMAATAKTRDIVGALGEAFKGNLDGAFERLGKKTRVEASVREYEERSTEIDGGVSVPILGGVQIDAGVTSQSATDYSHFAGPASRLPQLVSGMTMRG